MDYNEMKNDKLQEAIIKVETLQKEYEVTLQQYQEAGNNYINTLDNSNTLDNEFVAIKGRTWWGSSGLKEGTVSSQNECESMCASDTKCTGATFNPVKKYCWTRGGDGKLSTGENDDYALLTKQKAALGFTNSLNDKLMSINTEITTLLKDINPQVNEQQQEANIKQQQLNDSYQKLLENKMVMEKQLQEYYSIDKENENQTLFVTQNNTLLRFWVLITCLVLIFTIRKIYGAENLPFSIIFWLSVIIIMIILTYSLNNPSGFFMMLILIFFIVIIKTQ
jgi:hypothetical protein